MRKGFETRTFIRILPILLSVVLQSCGEDVSGEVERELSSMSLRDKVGQMFIIRLSALDTTQSPKEIQHAFKSFYTLPQRCIDFDREYPVGGVTLFANHIKDPEQLKKLTSDIHSRLRNHPLVCVDEEGGRVARVANTKAFDLKTFASMRDIARKGRPRDAYDAASYIGNYLKEYGFDISFAPVADVGTGAAVKVIGPRSFGNDPDSVSGFVRKYLKGFSDAGIAGCLKHFPGQGEVKGDTHKGYVTNGKSLPDLKKCELVPFAAGIKSGARMVMVGHVSVPALDSTRRNGHVIPASMSSKVMEGVLRGQLGFKGVIVTDGIDMGAIMQDYSVEQATVGVVKAGADIVMLPFDYIRAFNALYGAVETGEIPEERIDESVRRILKLKRSIKR